jgi:hypothetical protein
LLIEHVRDTAIGSCDSVLDSTTRTAKRWKKAGATTTGLRVLIPDIVDDVIFHLLNAIDNNELRLKFTDKDGHTVNLLKEGKSELGGEYMGGNWRAKFSKERFADDVDDEKLRRLARDIGKKILKGELE